VAFEVPFEVGKVACKLAWDSLTAKVELPMQVMMF